MSPLSLALLKPVERLGSGPSLISRDDPSSFYAYSEGFSIAVKIVISLAVVGIVIGIGLGIYFFVRKRRKNRARQNAAFEPQRGGLAVMTTEAQGNDVAEAFVNAHRPNQKLKGYKALLPLETTLVDEERRESSKENIGIPRPPRATDSPFETAPRDGGELGKSLLSHPAPTIEDRAELPSSQQFDDDTSYKSSSQEVHDRAIDPRFTTTRAPPPPPVLTSPDAPDAPGNPFTSLHDSDASEHPRRKILNGSPFQDYNVEAHSDAATPTPLSPFAPYELRFYPPKRSSSYYPDDPEDDFAKGKSYQ